MNIVEILELNGYKKKDYGFTRNTDTRTHWVTLFNSGELQMYGYYSFDEEEYDKLYDTGIIEVDAEQLEFLIRIFTRNHN